MSKNFKMPEAGVKQEKALVAPNSAKKIFPIVGIGASAGGVHGA